jgi:predicted metal-dependent HD superfamily phosphohydrolase
MSVKLPDEKRWQQLCATSGVRDEDSREYRRVVAAYGEPGRYYHNLQHIGECLAEFDAVRALVKQPLLVEWALWFHDVVYDSKAGDNEERSAEAARHFLANGGMNPADVEVVTQLVIMTKHHNTGADVDPQIIVDVDLSILGREETRFFEYEDAIRKEYAWVEEGLFRKKRAEILERFLQRERLYATDFFRDKYEAQARRNLEKSISLLKS